MLEILLRYTVLGCLVSILNNSLAIHLDLRVWQLFYGRRILSVVARHIRRQAYRS